MGFALGQTPGPSLPLPGICRSLRGLGCQQYFQCVRVTGFPLYLCDLDQAHHLGSSCVNMVYLVLVSTLGAVRREGGSCTEGSRLWSVALSTQ